MDIEEYDNLLDEAYKKIPDNVKKSNRFEIPPVKIRYEGRNTYISNFTKIINTLNRSEKHFMSVFLKMAGTRGEVRGSQLFLKSHYKARVLNRLIKSYAEDYVLCDVCSKPDTRITKEGRKEYLKCAACGARTEIKER